MLNLTSGVRLEGDEELVFRTVDAEQAAGVGLYVADILESSGLTEDRVRAAVATLLASDALEEGPRDDQLGPRYVVGRAVSVGR
jgi:hypothetical protein